MRGWLPLFLAAVLVTAIARFPLALAVHWSGAPVSAERIEGTIWKGRLEGATVDGYRLGRIDVSTRALPLLTGSVTSAVDVRGPVANGAALVSVRPGRLTFKLAEADVQIAPLNLRDAFGAPMSGTVEIRADNLTIAGGACRSGTVSISTDTLQKSAVRYGGEGFRLSGDGHCEDDIFLLPLSGSGPEGAADVTIRISAAGYQTELLIDPAEPDFAAVLSAYGFQQVGTRYSLIQRGEVFQ